MVIPRGSPTAVAATAIMAPAKKQNIRALTIGDGGAQEGAAQYRQDIPRQQAQEQIGCGDTVRHEERADHELGAGHMFTRK